MALAGLLLFVRVVIAGVFGLAAASKAVRFKTFVRSLADFGVPRVLRPTVAAAVLTAEAVVAISLVLISVWAGFLLAGALLLAFSLAILSRLRAGTTASCFCFGVEETAMGAANLWRNTLLFTLASAGLALSLDRGPAGVAIGVGPTATILVAACLLVIVIARLPSIAQAVSTAPYQVERSQANE